jgi:4-amino-4-deoxy-L-arabinose transferase-like glycosyltransferase
LNRTPHASDSATLPVRAPETTPEPAPARRGIAPLLVIVLAGAAVRLALWGWFQDLPIRIFDESDYNTLALNLVRHGELAFRPGTPASLRPPLYPALVAGLYGLFGEENFQAVRLFQAGLSLLTLLLVYRLGAEVYSHRVGLCLAAGYAFYPSLLGCNNLVLTEVLFTFLLCATCYTLVRFLRRESLMDLVWTGVVLGLGALTRSVLWLFPPVLGVLLLVVGRASFPRRVLAVAVLGGAFAATLAPWAIRNTRLEKTFVPVDTMGGRNFMMGNYEHTPLYRSWDAVSVAGAQNWDNVLAATTPSYRELTQGQRDKLALRYGIAFVLANPGLTLQRDVVKFFHFWGLERELVAGAGRGYFGNLSPAAVVGLTVVIFGSYVVALISGIFGLVLAPPTDRRVHWFLLLVIAFICGMHTLVFAHSRYHLPVMPLVLAYAAGAWVQAPQIWRRRGHWSFWLAAGLSGVFVGGWLWEILVVDGERFFHLLRTAA